VASPDARDGSLAIHADASVYAGLFDGAETARLELAAGRRAYVHLVRGSLEVNGESLQAGDALRIEDEPGVSLERGHDAEVLLFDLP
jgi:quercetin 2,3-dioxygenase